MSSVRVLILSTLCATLGFLAAGAASAVAPALAGKGYELRSEFAAPGTGLAVDESSSALVETLGVKNDLYVADGNKVEVFKPEPGPTATLASEFTGLETPAHSFSARDVAVDNATEPHEALDPSAGDVYVVDEHADVVDKFTAEGKYVGQLTGICAAAGPCSPAETPFASVPAVAVNAEGDVWVFDEEGETRETQLSEFSDTGEFIRSFKTGYEKSGGRGLAVDSSGDVYVVAKHFLTSPVVAKFSSTGSKLAEFGEGSISEDASLAVDSATNNLFVDTNFEPSRILEYGPFGEPYSGPVETFPVAGLPELWGVAVDGTSRIVYASERNVGKVAVMQFVELPEVVTGGASEQTATSATLSGMVNPLGITVNSCEFEYGLTTAYGQVAPCEAKPDAAEIGAGTAPVTVHAKVEDLEPGKLYHYRLKAGNAPYGSEPGLDATFGPPEVTGVSFTEVGSDSARVSAQVDPEQSDTSYMVEYGTSTAYGSSTKPVSVGAGSVSVGISEALAGLAAQSTYHFRVVASNASGVRYGPDLVFTTLVTPPAESSVLPDGRVYEMVSSPDNDDSEVYAPKADLGAEFTHVYDTEVPFRAAADGDAVAFVGAPSGAGGNGHSGEGAGNEYFAQRCAGSAGCPGNGWEASDIQPPGATTPVYQGFTSDLSEGFLDADDVAPLSGEASAIDRGLPAGAGAGYNILYQNPFGSEAYRPLFTTKPAARGFEEFGGTGVEDPFVTEASAVAKGAAQEEPVAFAGTAAGHVLFEADDALLPGTGKLEKELRADAQNEVAAKENHNYLYDSDAGHLSLVDLLPGAGEVAPDATFGGAGNDFSHAISTDGSRVYWTDLASNEVFLREGEAKTVHVSKGAAQFLTASANGQYAFYSEAGQLFRFDLEGRTANEQHLEVTAEHAGVEGVLGSSEDGEYVYFVATGVLDESGAVEGKPNLYLYHAGTTTLVATLSTEDNGKLWFDTEGAGEPGFGDWMPGTGYRTAQVTPDGRGVVFMSQASLKTVNFPDGYDNAGCSNGSQKVGCEEVYVYQAGAGGLFCASCAPSGAPPSVHDGYSAEQLAAFLPASWSNTYQMRWMSANGGRVFFDTFEPLVSRDENGTLDVYEWERDGEGSCAQADGCIYLLSSGTGTQGNASYLVDADETGENVFVATRSQLLPVDQNDSVDLYDARVNGYEPPAPQTCLGTGCQGAPPPPPIFATPSSETFSGPGNFPPPSTTVTKTKAKALTRAQKLAKALKACRVKPKKKRAQCEAQARKAYGAKTKAKDNKANDKRRAK